MNPFAALAGSLTHSLRKLGAVTLFLLDILRRCPAILARPKLVTQEVYKSGVLSLVIIMTSGFFVGMVIGLQGYDSLSRLRQEGILGAGVALTLLKELGPVVTALLFAGRAGTAMASEIGLMNATDQLSAMEVMAVDPVQRIVVPRFLGAVISVPLLTAIFNSIGILGAWFIGVAVMGVDNGEFWTQMQEYVEPADVWEGVWKSVAFGVTAGLVAVFEGYHSPPTAQGVGMATTRTVVTTSIAVLILDYLITAFLL
ncbi:MAG: lipid asymmetry maintenance ABC transporter permease subunit MlaE [Gammaproteobacteria bacterium]|jgi:phospholipid/cholesterol/gamma-HCH transport system permease protein|nr:lipid asymmetry maintenance ABC transporter permease subunit MlaE [Gammaproteobacteria bacterium]